MEGCLARLARSMQMGSAFGSLGFCGIGLGSIGSACAAVLKSKKGGGEIVRMRELRESEGWETDKGAWIDDGTKCIYG